MPGKFHISSGLHLTGGLPVLEETPRAVSAAVSADVCAAGTYSRPVP